MTNRSHAGQPNGRSGTARAVAGRALTVALIAGACWAIGLGLANALAVGVFLAALYGLRAMAPGEDESWPAEPETPRNSGTRREVSRLSWGLHGQDSRVDRWSARRLHALAGRRLASRGLDLDAPQDTAACRQILGSRTYDTLSLDPNNLPRYADFVAALDVIERISLEETPR